MNSSQATQSTLDAQLAPPAVRSGVHPATTAPKNRRRRLGGTRWGLTLLAAVIGLVFVAPALWILIGSFRPTDDIFSSLTPLNWGLIIPSRASFNNYLALLTSGGFAHALGNTVLVCIGSVLLGLLLSLPAAYALSAFKFPGRNVIFGFVVISFMMPFDAIAIPLSQLFTDWGLTNTLVGLILPGIGNGLAIFNLRQHFLSIPLSYREAAMLEGASEPRILFSVYVPMSGAAITNSMLLIFLGQWTAYLWPLLVVSDNSLQVAPVALAMTFGEHAADYGQNFAGIVMLSLIPAIIVFFLQRVFGQLSLSSGED
jgi:putative chitobiose transport system permease protein